MPLMTTGGHRRGPTAALVLVATLTIAGCSKPAPSPAQARKTRVEHRLRSSFSVAQSTCILDRLDPAALRAVDRTTKLAAQTKELAAYSDAVANCVTDPTGKTTTTSG